MATQTPDTRSERVKTNIMLEARQRDGLRELARREDLHPSQLIRRAVDKLLREHGL